MKFIIRWCTVPVEICAALLFMCRCRFVFGDCLPLSLALHHLPTNKSCNHNTHICSTAHLNHRAATCAPPPPPLTLPPSQRCALPPPPHRRQAAANVALLRCRHRRSCRAAATVLLPSRCAPLPPPPRRRQAAANLALSRCRHRCCCRRRRATVCWLVVVLLSAVRCRHHMPSCDHQRTRCRPLLPINCLPQSSNELICVTSHQGICNERDILTCVYSQL